MHNLYEIVRTYRDRAWNTQLEPLFGWNPTSDEGPESESEQWWYLQGKAEAYASIMSELELSR
jgi:hypothetical protein